MNIGEGEEQLKRTEIGRRGEPVLRPVYLPGYVAWEHEIQHHDPLTDIFSLGLIMASLACGLNLNESAAAESFVSHRRNLFQLNPDLHPVLAQAILRMTELDRRRRPPDLPAVVAGLVNYRDQTVEFDIDLARLPGLQVRDVGGRSQAILAKLRDRLFDLSRRNSLLHFRPTMATLNLTQASIPLLLDIRNIRPEQLLIGNEAFQSQLAEGKPISLNKYLNFAEAVYLPSLLERIIADARRDQQEFGFAQLRLVLCFLSWANLKVKPAESYNSPLVMLPVRLSKTKGIRDTYYLEALSSDAEVNPVVRHQFRQLYNIALPETVDLSVGGLQSLFALLTARIQASEPAVEIACIDRPRIDLIHEKAQRRLDQYRRNARVSGRGVRSFLNLDYSYDPVNFHPLGIKLFAAKIRTPCSHLRELLEVKPRPRTFAVPDASAPPDSTAPGGDSPTTPEPADDEVERSFYQLRDSSEGNPYLWNFDLCAVTLANLRYRRMSLVRDYEAILQDSRANGAFEATFSLAPRPVAREPAAAPALDDRHDVVPSDPTQIAAVAEARLGNSYIIQGPPGTGKSQTITNLIADFVARGKRVLFVCEKRAAIDVVHARLRQRGLGALCCVVHDSQTDKKEFIHDLKGIYEALLAPRAPAAPPASRADVLRDLQREMAPLERFDDAMAAEHPRAGMPLRSLLDRCVALRDSRPKLSSEDYERLPRYSEWWQSRDRLASLEPALRDLNADGVFARHPLKLLSPKLAEVEHPMEAVRAAIGPAGEALERLALAMQRSGVPVDQWTTLERIRLLAEYADRLSPLASAGNLALLDPRSERAGQLAGAVSEVRQAESQLVAAQELATGWTSKLPAAETTIALQQARLFVGKLLSFLSPGWWRMRRLLNRSYNFRAHAVRPTWSQVLTTLLVEHEAAARCEQAKQQSMARFQLQRSAIEIDGLVHELRNWLATIPDWLSRIHAAILRSSKGQDFAARILAAREPLRSFERCIDGVLTGVDRLSVEQLRRGCDEIAANIRLVPQALLILGELGGLPPKIGQTLRDFPLDLQQVEAAVAHATWENVCQTDRDVGRTTGKLRQRRIGRIESSFDLWLNANAREMSESVCRRFLDHVRVSNAPSAQLNPQERELKRAYSQGRRALEHEFGKSMRYRSIRDLIDAETGLVIRDLKPVWMMSPLSVSDTLPLAGDFVDVVIFDEASQVPLEESVPSLFRAAQVIVVGDEMQLPPTDFFTTHSSDDDDLVLGNGDGHMQYDLSSDSFLNHAAKNLSSTMLGWHYRSASESLISFSNWAFYDGRLLTVPDQRLLGHADGGSAGCELLLSRPLSVHFLPNGVYEKRRNRAEADYIAGLVRDLLVRREGLSIGVIAFSEAQQDEINSALEQLAQTDDAFRQLLEEELQREVDGQFVGLLVKNLENIQGDERDVIVLSICYGPGPDGKMLMNFGPTNQSGGEKRLNVAFSRAKRQMAVVSSIRYSQITNDYNEGANCLKNYLRYAEATSQGDLAASHRVLAGMSRWREAGGGTAARAQNPVVAELAAALRRRGYVVDEGIGQSHFRVDLAVRRDGDHGYRLGILVDTLEQYEQLDPLERNMTRPRLLRNFGWQVTAVLGKDWYDDMPAELNRIVSLLEAS